MNSARAARLASYLLLSLIMVAPEAWAYLDPSTGSMILSAIVGLFATAALAIRTFWYRLKGLVRRREPQQRREPASGEQPSAPESRPAAD